MSLIALITVSTILFILGLPIFIVLGVSSLVTLHVEGIPLITTFLRMFTGLNKFVYIALPLFLSSALFMNESGAMESIINFCKSILGKIPGSLGQVNIAASVLFAGISGSALIDSMTIGKLLIPAMIKEGYDKEFSAAITGASSIIGPVIPPSTSMIIFGTITQTSILALFLAGVVPGIMIGIFLGLYCHIISIRRKYPVYQGQTSLRKIISSFGKALPALSIIVIIFWGLFGGIITIAETGGLAALSSLIIGKLFYKLQWRRIPFILLQVGVSASTIAVILATANIWSWLAGRLGISEKLGNFLLQLTSNPIGFLLVTIVFLLVMGAFVETTANIIIFAPILTPIAASYGIGSIHFAWVMVFTLLIGLLTPPFGLVLYVVQDIAGISFEKVVKATLPMIFVLLIVLLLITLIPELVTTVPRLVIGTIP